jgi:hypothetical protein
MIVKRPPRTSAARPADAGSVSEPVNGNDVVAVATVAGAVGVVDPSVAIDVDVDPKAPSVVVDAGRVVVVVLESSAVVGETTMDVVVVGCSVVVEVLPCSPTVVVVGATVVVVVSGGSVEVLPCSASVVVVARATVVVVVGGKVAVDVVVGATVVVVVDGKPSPQTCVTLNVEPSLPPLICAVALRIVSSIDTSTVANLGFDESTTPETVPAFSNVAESDTNESPCEFGRTKTQPGPWPQSLA